MKKYKLLLNLLESFCIKLMVTFLILMIFFIFMQVIFRYILNDPLFWTEEVSRHLMIYAAFLGAAVAYRRNVHLGVDVFLSKLSKKIRKVILSCICLVTFGYSLFLIIVGFEIVEKTMRQTSSALRYKMGYVYLIIPISFIIILLFSVEKIINLWPKSSVVSYDGLVSKGTQKEVTCK